MSLVWVDGALVERERATVSIDDLGLLYGAGCFETMRAFGGVVFRLDQHLARLEAGFAALGVRPPARDALRAAIAETLRANGLGEARIRLTVTPGRGTGRPDLSAATTPTVIVVAEPPPPDPPPAHMIVASQRVDPSRPLAGAKTTSYLVSLLALAEARAAGADEALLLSTDGTIAEAASANMFIVLRGVLHTPPLTTGALPGVTRAAVLECAAALAIPVHEDPIPLADLAHADEVFLTNSIARLRPVASIEDYWDAPASVPGPLTHRLREAYAGLVASECRNESPKG